MSNINKTTQRPPVRKKTLAIAMSALLGGTQAVDAQQVLEEIVVTATKREANLQDIPVSITAFTTDDIQRRGFRGLADYASYIPGTCPRTARTGREFRGISRRCRLRESSSAPTPPAASTSMSNPLPRPASIPTRVLSISNASRP